MTVQTQGYPGLPGWELGARPVTSPCTKVYVKKPHIRITREVPKRNTSTKVGKERRLDGDHGTGWAVVPYVGGWVGCSALRGWMGGL